MAVRIEKRLTFIHVGKNGGTSITRLLDANFKTEHSKFKHDSYDELPESWKDNVFCVIRNPYDRLLSLYNFSIKKYEKRKMSERLDVLKKGFKNFVNNEHDKKWYGEIGGWEKLTQSRQLPSDKSKIEILRLENLEHDWRSLCDKYDLTYHPIGRENSTRDDNSYRQQYDSSMILTVNEKWAEDIALGEYEF